MNGSSVALEIPTPPASPARTRGPLVRAWTARIADETQYLAFAHAHALPMLLAQPGCEAVHFVPLGGSRQAVVTLWTDDAAIRACEASAPYRDTVAALMASDIIEGEPSLTVADLAPPVLDVVVALLDQRPAL